MGGIAGFLDWRCSLSVQNDQKLTEIALDSGANRRRRGPDRRQNPTPALSRYTFFGRRRRNRRDDDPKENYYVDWAAGPYLWMLYAIILLVAFDATATWLIIRQGVEEGNPLIVWILGLGPVAFWAVKLGPLPLFLVLLAVKRFFVWARFLVWLIFLVYAFLAAFHLWGIWSILGV